MGDLLFIAGSEALTLWESQETYDALNRDDKELFLVEGANHFDMYDLEPYVTQSVDKMVEFFGKHL